METGKDGLPTFPSFPDFSSSHNLSIEIKFQPSYGLTQKDNSEESEMREKEKKGDGQWSWNWIHLYHINKILLYNKKFIKKIDNIKEKHAFWTILKKDKRLQLIIVERNDFIFPPKKNKTQNPILDYFQQLFYLYLL